MRKGTQEALAELLRQLSIRQGHHLTNFNTYADRIIEHLRTTGWTAPEDPWQVALLKDGKWVVKENEIIRIELWEQKLADEIADLLNGRTPPAEPTKPRWSVDRMTGSLGHRLMDHDTIVGEIYSHTRATSIRDALNARDSL